MKATLPSGQLNELLQCVIDIPGGEKIILNNLPDISDSKQAVYNNEGIIGRSNPLYTFSYSGERNIGMQLHFFVTHPDDIQRNLRYKRLIESAVYPREGAGDGTSYLPPPVCTIQAGELLARGPLCVILRSYSVRYPTDVVWDEATYLPYRFDMETSWTVVYSSVNLPSQDRIITIGR